MSWDLDCMSVLPEDWQEDVMDNFTPQYLAERLSDYIVVLQQQIVDLEKDIQEYVDAQPPI